jgi:hypothetical protein
MINYKKKYLKYKFKFEKLNSNQKGGMYASERILTEEQHNKLFRNEYDITKESLGLCLHFNCERNINRNGVCCNGCFYDNHSYKCDDKYDYSHNNREKLLEIKNILDSKDKLTASEIQAANPQTFQSTPTLLSFQQQAQSGTGLFSAITPQQPPSTTAFTSYRSNSLPNSPSNSPLNSPSNSTSVSLARQNSNDTDRGHVKSYILDSHILFETDPELWLHRHTEDCIPGSALWTGFIDQNIAQIYSSKARGRGLYDKEALQMLKDGGVVHESIIFTEFLIATSQSIIQRIGEFPNGTYTMMFLSPTDNPSMGDDKFKHIVIIGKTQSGQYILVDRQENEISIANTSCQKYVYIGNRRIQDYLDAYRQITSANGVSFKLIIYDRVTRDFDNIRIF